MVKKSLQTSLEGRKLAKKALIALSLTQQQLAVALGVTRQPISKFFNGKPVDRNLFLRICEKLDQDWQEIAELDDAMDVEQNFTQESDIDALVQEIREKVKPSIKKRCGEMQVLDMTQPIELTGERGIYTNVNILEQITGRRRVAIAELLQNVDSENFERCGLNQAAEKRVPGLEAVQRYHKLMVLGKPGAGKSTFLKYLAMQCIEALFQENRVPLFITLKDFAEAQKKPSLPEYVAQQFVLCGVEKASDKAEQLLRQGRALILLDGLDEVREEDTKQLVNQICEVANYFHGNQIIITCRIAAKEYTFQGFTEVEMADFDKEQIVTFTQNWFRSDLVKAQRCIQKLEENQPIQELATNPLLLTLLCLVFGETGDFPANRSELYQEGIDVLLKKWDAKRNIERDQVYKNLSLQRKENLLSQIALTTFEQKDYFFKQKRVEEYIADFIQNLYKEEPDPEALRLDSEVVLKSIEAQHGLLVERAKGIYSFSHLTFHEYFTARAISANVNPSYIDETLLHLLQHIYEPRWREVLLLFCEMVNSADLFLFLMKYQIDIFFSKSNNLQKFLTWISQKSSEVSSPYKPRVVRAFYLCLAVGIYAIDNSTLPSFEHYNIYEMGTLLSAVDETILLDFYQGNGWGFWMGNPEGYLDKSIALDFSLCHARVHASLLARIAKREELMLLVDPDEAETLYLFDQTNFDKIIEELEKAINDSNDSINKDFLKKLIRLYNNLPDIYQNVEVYQDWYKTKSKTWGEKFRQVINKHRNIDYKWEFSEQEWGMLRAYCYANALLMNCLNSDCYISWEIRQEIEDTLLLPISEIENRPLKNILTVLKKTGIKNLGDTLGINI